MKLSLDGGGIISYFWRRSKTTDMKQRTKITTPGVEKRSVSAPAELFTAADARAEQRRMSNFSEYVRDLMRRDVEGKLLPNPTQQEAA